jgi:chemotaxis receptor (MCP) glutamine deamidase CheD
VSVPEGAKILILQFGGCDFRQGNSLAIRQANIVNIQQQLSKRGIRIIRTDGPVRLLWLLGLFNQIIFV